MQPVKLIYLVIGGSFLYFGVMGNTVVIIYFGLVRKCRQKYDLLLLILGVADLLASLSNIMVDWVDFLPPFGWKFDGIMCKYILDIGFSTNTFACYVLVLLFYVRYRCIANPINHGITKPRIIIASLVIFIVSILCCIPFMLTKVYKNGICYNEKTAIFGSEDLRNYYVYYLIIHPVGRFFLPLIMMGYCCIQTGICLNSSDNMIISDAVKTRNKRVFRTIVCLVLIFFVSVGTFEVYWFILCINIIHSRQVHRDSIWIGFLASYYLNSSFNVLVYAGYMPHFRRFCYTLLTCCKHKGL